MTARDFDPVLSAALRNELASLADGDAIDPAAARPRTRLRPQVWITAATALVLLIATLGVLRIATDAHPVAPAAPAVADPLVQLRDPAYGDHLDEVRPLLQQRGTGPGTYALDVPAGVSSVRAVIRCAPTALFRITIGKWVAAQCSADAQAGYGDVPVTAGRYGVVVSVPEGTVWRMVVVATPGASTVVPTMVTGGTAYPVPERDDDLPVGLESGGRGTARGVLTAPVDELAIATTCRGTGGLVITMSNGLRFGTDANPVACSPTGQRSVQAAGNDTAKGYRSDGAMTYSVRAIGDVTWSAVFSSRTEERLPYPAVTGAVVGRIRGASVESSGTLDRATDSLRIVITCRGTGGLAVGVGGGDSALVSPTGAGSWCDRFEAKRSEVALTPEPGAQAPGTQRFTIRPRGDVLWTVTFIDAD